MVAVFVAAICEPEDNPGTLAARGALVIVTCAPSPTVLKRLMMSPERIRIQP